MKRKLYQQIANTIQAIKTCEKVDTKEPWFDRHYEKITEYENDHLPSGSGIDNGCKINLEKSNINRIVIDSSYHMMDENGYYAGWIDFTITIKPHLVFDIDMDIKGPFSKYKESYGLKDYLYETFDYALKQEIDD